MSRHLASDPPTAAVGHAEHGQPVRRAHDLRAVLIIIALPVVYLFGLDVNGLSLPAEARIAAVADGMLAGGDLLLPRFGGRIRLKKPPLAYWLTALCGLPAGRVSVWSARLTGVLAAGCCLLLLHALAEQELGPGVGIWAVLFLGSTHAFVYYARLCTIEMPLLACTLLCVYAWLRAHRERAALLQRQSGSLGGAGWLLLSYAGLGLGMLLKGPVILITVFLVLLARRIPRSAGARRRPAAFPRRWHLAGLLLVLLLVLPWVMGVLLRLPGAWELWLRETAGRFAGFDHRHGPWYYLAVVPVDALPWLPLAVIACLRLRRDPWTWSRVGWCGWWFLLLLAFFSLFASKKHSYALPLYPALACLCACFVRGTLAASAGAGMEGAGRVLRRVCLALGVAWLAGGPLLYLRLAGRLGGYDYAPPSAFTRLAPAACALVAAAGLLALAAAARGRTSRSLRFSCAAAVVALMLAHAALPWYWRGRAMARAVEAAGDWLPPSGRAVYAAGVPYLEREVLVYYLRRPLLAPPLGGAAGGGEWRLLAAGKRELVKRVSGRGGDGRCWEVSGVRTAGPDLDWSWLRLRRLRAITDDRRGR